MPKVTPKQIFEHIQEEMFGPWIRKGERMLMGQHGEVWRQTNIITILKKGEEIRPRKIQINQLILIVRKNLEKVMKQGFASTQKEQGDYQKLPSLLNTIIHTIANTIIIQSIVPEGRT